MRYDFDTLVIGDKRINLRDESIHALLDMDGMGTPPIEWVTSRSPLQHGETPLLYRFGKRTMTLAFYDRSKYSQFLQASTSVQQRNQAYWDARRRGVQDFRPNHNNFLLEPMRLEKRVGDKDYALDVYVADGPQLDYRASGGSWIGNGQAYTVRLFAFNPFWYDAEWTISSFAPSAGGSFVFPIDFPIVFDEDLFIETRQIDYAGDWRSDFKIRVTGPCTGAKIQNLTSGVQVTINYRIVAGETVELFQSDGALFVNSSLPSRGANGTILGVLTPDSDLANLALYPGENQIKVTFTEARAGETQVDIMYRARYLGV